MATNARSPAASPQSTTPRLGMVWIPGGTFRMGSNDFYPEERPVREVRVNGFWIDCHPVANEQFARFVAATGYVTVAEQPPNAALDPGALAADRTGHGRADDPHPYCKGDGPW
jgi:formylglycine-generating enzyme